MTKVRAIFMTALLALSLPAMSQAIELQEATVKAWKEYVRGADLRMHDRLGAQAHFLWIDESPERAAQLRRGETLVMPVVGRGTEEVPNGLIHHWIGAAFIPNATIENLMAVLHNYDRYKDIYKPVVTGSQLRACTASDQEFSMTLRRHVLFVSAAVEGQYREHDVAVDAHSGYSISDTTSVREIENYGRPGQQLLPEDTGNGFIWRLHSIARYEERDGGLYLEYEAIALTRDIPSSLRWLVTPAVNHLSINSLTTMLHDTSAAVSAHPLPQVAQCNGWSRQVAVVKSRGEQ